MDLQEKTKSKSDRGKSGPTSDHPRLLQDHQGLLPESLKICIVTPDLEGPIKNGGIGTFCANLSKLLSSVGHEVTILFSEIIAPEGNLKWMGRFTQLGISVVTVENLDNHDPYANQAPYEPIFLKRSRRIAEYLDRSSFDMVHFQDWKANGFHAIRLRKTGLGLINTQIFVTLHSPSLWLRQGMQEQLQDPVTELSLDYAERYCCENADQLIAPTQHMLDWSASEGWKIQANKRVLPYCYTPTSDKTAQATPDPSHIIFFGRLETRKGLGIFLDGLKRHLNANSQFCIRKVTLLGKPGRHCGQPVEPFLEHWLKTARQIQLVKEFSRDTHSAIQYIKHTGGIVFLPSLLDNCPFAAIECIEHGLPFFAAATGGIPQIVHPDHQFEATASGVEQTLGMLDTYKWDQNHPYQAILQNKKWIELHNELELRTSCENLKESVDTPKKTQLAARVSVCIPYYNQPEYLPQALESIRDNDYENIQVIVCNDGSSTADARRVFKEEEGKHNSDEWAFVEQENHGVCSARNKAATLATGDYLVFMDADNVARVDMLSKMVNAMEHSGADALTCYFTAFSSKYAPDENTRPDFIYRPTGAVPLLCLMENTFGDANCIIKRSTFEAVGGFRGKPLSAYADWDLFLRLHLAGIRVDLIPRELFWYRHRPDSMLRTANTTEEYLYLINDALEHHPEMARELAQQLTLPLYQQIQSLEKRVGRDRFGRLSRPQVPWHKHAYRWYRRMLGDPRYRKSLTL